MDYLGRYQLGVHVPLTLFTVDSTGEPLHCDDSPTIKVLAQDGDTIVDTKEIPALNRDRYKGLFHYRLFLGANPHVPVSEAFAVGRIFIYYEWVIDGTTYGDLAVLDAVASGNDAGAVISMERFDRPHGDFLVMQLDTGKIIAGRNPRIP